MIKIRGIFFFPIILFLFVSCEERYRTFNSFIVTPKDNTSSADTTIIDSLGRFEFSRISKAGIGGLSGFSYIGPSHKNRKLCIVFAGRVRTNFTHSFATISFSINGDDKEELLVWRSVNLRTHFYDTNKWCSFRDSLFLPPDFKGKPYQKITVIAFQGDGVGENFDMDTLKVWFKEKR